MDPSGDGDNWYAYCGNSPTGGTDPSGLYPLSVNGSILGDSEAMRFGDQYSQGISIPIYSVVWTVDKTTNQAVACKITGVYILKLTEPRWADLMHNVRAAESVRKLQNKNLLHSLILGDSSAIGGYYGGSGSWLKDRVGTNMPLDYKEAAKSPKFNHPELYQAFRDFGNFNAGAVAAALGFTLKQLVDSATDAHNLQNHTLGQADDGFGIAMESNGWNWYNQTYGGGK